MSSFLVSMTISRFINFLQRFVHFTLLSSSSIHTCNITALQDYNFGHMFLLFELTLDDDYSNLAVSPTLDLAPNYPHQDRPQH